MGKMIHLMLAILCFIFIGWVNVACSDGEYIIAEKEVFVLEQPYPLNYPSTNPKPNKKIAILKKGQKVKVIGRQHGKDFLVYSIRVNDGKTGYLIYNEKDFRIVPE